MSIFSSLRGFRSLERFVDVLETITAQSQTVSFQEGISLWEPASWMMLLGAACLLGGLFAPRPASAQFFTPSSADFEDVASSSTTIGDVNGDDNPDLLFTGSTGGFSDDGNSFLYTGDGMGGFSKVDAGFTGIVDGESSMGDVNNDGNTDILLVGAQSTDSNAERLAVLYLGDGEGGFSQADAGLAGAKGAATAMGDVNNDGNDDLLITGETSNGEESTVYLSNGDGSFSEAEAGLLGLQSGSALIEDVDADGNPDLLITGRDGSATAHTSLYLGDGNGGFSGANAGLNGVQTSGVAIEDADGDGNLDLLITGDADGSLFSQTPTATLYLGDGSGGFSSAGLDLPGTAEGSASIGDVNRDGHPDLFLTGDPLEGSPALYLGDGQGGFSDAQIGLPRFFASSASLTDLNGDAHPDVFIAGTADRGGTTEEVTAVYFWLRDGGPLRHSDASLRGTEEGSSSIGDVNNDGRADLLITGGEGFDDDPSARLYLSDGEGGFSEAGADLTGVIESSSTAADMNADGNLDLLVTGLDSEENRTTTLYLGNGDGSFSPANAGLVGVEEGASSIADVDTDGNLDVLITGRNTSGNANATLYLGDGEGGFSEAETDLDGVRLSATAIEDVDTDGNPDLLITGSGSATLYLGDGEGGFSTADASLSGVSNGSASIGDVNTDGHPDLLITGDAGGFNDNPTTTLYLNDGQGGFSQAEASLPGLRVSSSAIGDVNGDGLPDLVLTGRNSETDHMTTLYLGHGDGTFTPTATALTGVRYGSSTLGDVGRDGDLDLLVTGEGRPEGDLTKTATLYENLTNTGDTLVASTSQTVSTNGVQSFGNTGIELDFSGVTQEGTVTVNRYAGAPSRADGIPESNVSLYRLQIEAGRDLRFNSTQVRLAVSSFGGINDPTNVTIYKRPNDGVGSFSSLETSVGTNGTSDDISDDTLYAKTNTLSEFVLASNTEPLPVEIAGFDATVEEGAVRLAWQTASETNNAGFEVQRKARAGNWTSIGRVEGAGTTSQPQRYRFTDGDLPYEADRLTYRLKQVDTDGSASFSETVTVERGVTEVQLLGTYPNPARQQATIRYALPEKQDVTLRLYDVLGRQVRTVQPGEIQGRQELRVDVSGLASGTYFLRLTADGQTRTQKLTIAR